MKQSNEAKKRQSAAPRSTQRARARTGSAGVPAKRSTGEAGGSDRYWMRCPRCGMGLIETVRGAIKTERCTACGAVWADPRDVERAWGEETPDLFKPFRKA